MSKRIIDKIKQMSYSLRNTSHLFNPKQNNLDPLKQQSHKNNQHPAYKIFNDNKNNFKQNFQKLKSALNNQKGSPLASLNQKLRQNYNKQLKNLYPQKIQQLQKHFKQKSSTFNQSPKKVILIAQDVKHFLSNLPQKSNTKKPDLNQYRKKLQDLIQKNKIRLQKLRGNNHKQFKSKFYKIQQVLSTAKESLISKGSSNLSYFQTIFKKLFGRLILLVLLGSFMYGIGSSIPREIRIYMSRRKQSNQLKKDNTAVDTKSQL